MLNNESSWQAVLDKDKSADGQFFYGVHTTGVYCRPSCPSKRPLRKNVTFYETASDAERDGLRACKRCRPSSGSNLNADRVQKVCEYIREHVGEEGTLTLEQLGRETGLSPFHLQRMFKSVVGVTPKQYIEACRVERLKGQLRKSDSVTTAIYDAGFGSSSRVYERVDTRLGMTPKQYRSGGKNVSISYGSTETVLGLMLVAATDRGLCFVQFGEAEKELARNLKAEYPNAEFERLAEPYSQQFALWMKSLSRHLAGEQAAALSDLPLDLKATAFQLKVWKYLQSIPYGEVQSYSEVANAVGAPSAARAVANACAANRVAIVIPCHRVIRGDGGLGGYRWGMERKRVLIDGERAKKSSLA